MLKCSTAFRRLEPSRARAAGYRLDARPASAPTARPPRWRRSSADLVMGPSAPGTPRSRDGATGTFTIARVALTTIPATGSSARPSAPRQWTAVGRTRTVPAVRRTPRRTRHAPTRRAWTRAIRFVDHYRLGFDAPRVRRRSGYWQLHHGRLELAAIVMSAHHRSRERSSASRENDLALMAVNSVDPSPLQAMSSGFSNRRSGPTAACLRIRFGQRDAGIVAGVGWSIADHAGRNDSSSPGAAGLLISIVAIPMFSWSVTATFVPRWSPTQFGIGNGDQARSGQCRLVVEGHRRGWRVGEVFKVQASASRRLAERAFVLDGDHRDELPPILVLAAESGPRRSHARRFS